MSTPIVFTPDMEQPEADEAATTAGLDDTLRGIREITFGHGGRPLRSVHAKAHGILNATFRVAGDLPPGLAHGLFAKPGSYRAVLRFSTIPGDLLDDSVSVPRGVALKVIGVEGPRLPGSEDATTQDFLMVNGPAFGAPNAAKFLGSLKAVAATTDRIEGVKKIVSRVARATESLIETFGGRSGLVLTLGGQPATEILGETFYSQTPFLYGPHVVKFSLAPASPNLLALVGRPVDLDASPTALREAVVKHFATEGGEWALRVQLNTDLAAMPIEDPSVVWPETASPFVTVATIAAPPQDAWSAALVAEVDDCYAFSPWHGLAAHRPLGSVNRARRDTYRNSAEFRLTRNRCPMHEPRNE